MLLTTAVTPENTLLPSELKTRVMELEDVIRTPGRVLPEARSKVVEEEDGPSYTLK